MFEHPPKKRITAKYVICIYNSPTSFVKLKTKVIFGLVLIKTIIKKCSIIHVVMCLLSLAGMTYLSGFQMFFHGDSAGCNCSILSERRLMWFYRLNIKLQLYKICEYCKKIVLLEQKHFLDNLFILQKFLSGNSFLDFPSWLTFANQTPGFYSTYFICVIGARTMMKHRNGGFQQNLF